MTYDEFANQATSDKASSSSSLTHIPVTVPRGSLDLSQNADQLVEDAVSSLKRIPSASAISRRSEKLSRVPTEQTIDAKDASAKLLSKAASTLTTLADATEDFMDTEPARDLERLLLFSPTESSMSAATFMIPASSSVSTREPSPITVSDGGASPAKSVLSGIVHSVASPANMSPASFTMATPPTVVGINVAPQESSMIDVELFGRQRPTSSDSQASLMASDSFSASPSKGDLQLELDSVPESADEHQSDHESDTSSQSSLFDDDHAKLVAAGAEDINPTSESVDATFIAAPSLGRKEHTVNVSTLPKHSRYRDTYLTLRKLPTVLHPAGKLNILHAVFAKANQAIHEYSHGSTKLASMDTVFPVFLSILIRANVPHLGAEIQFLEDFIDFDVISGESKIILTTLKAAYFHLVRDYETAHRF